ncbi:predicted protein [Naegleria gruberi]|uniref:Predicted protein n=1 Tax=Naegleria gruberi TaxID=5762 RepID=D2VEU1_NAEGR|nr:uncharacterized protein NAEGRDRAFT_67393 [Naegleria gruberi]EFC44565.1 predicted protein [Naegleria gruberi]|eukprot:XP_002677309.1 predicted protein [Naegleria gruberi strain NEG-M]
MWRDLYFTELKIGSQHQAHDTKVDYLQRLAQYSFSRDLNLKLTINSRINPHYSRNTALVEVINNVGHLVHIVKYNEIDTSFSTVAKVSYDFETIVYSRKGNGDYVKFSCHITNSLMQELRKPLSGN